jgi:hypothetical protein
MQTTSQPNHTKNIAIWHSTEVRPIILGSSYARIEIVATHKAFFSDSPKCIHVSNEDTLYKIDKTFTYDEALQFIESGNCDAIIEQVKKTAL